MKKLALIIACLMLAGCQAYYEQMQRQQEAEYSFYAKRYGLTPDEVDYLKQKQAEAEQRARNEQYQRYLEEEGRRIREHGIMGDAFNNHRTTNCIRNGDYVNCYTY